MRSRLRTALSRLLLCGSAALVATLAPTASAGDPPPANPLRGAEIPALLDKAKALRAKDPRDLGRQITALGDPVSPRGPDLDFLVEYVLAENSRPLRFLAIDAAQRIDAAGAAAAFLKRAQSEKDPARAILAVEALGYTATKEHAAALVELVKHPSVLVATQAADALARVGTSKEVDDLVSIGLAHADSHVTDHTAWAVQDLQKKPAAAVAMYEKIAAKKSDPRSIRAESAAALLKDKLAEPHKWTSPFDAGRKLLASAPAAPEVKGNETLVPRIQGALDWLREKMPAEHWLLCAAVKTVESGTEAESTPDYDSFTIRVAPVDTALKPAALAYKLHRFAVVMFRKRIGEPYKGHRGWEPALFDSYDLCVVGKMYEAGPGGVTRTAFIEQMLAKRPWGGL